MGREIDVVGHGPWHAAELGLDRLVAFQSVDPQSGHFCYGPSSSHQFFAAQEEIVRLVGEFREIHPMFATAIHISPGWSSATIPPVAPLLPALRTFGTPRYVCLNLLAPTTNASTLLEFVTSNQDSLVTEIGPLAEGVLRESMTGYRTEAEDAVRLGKALQRAVRRMTVASLELQDRPGGPRRAAKSLRASKMAIELARLGTTLQTSSPRVIAVVPDAPQTPR